MAEYTALLEDTLPKRRDRFRVTPAMLASAAASVPAGSRVPVIDGFDEPARAAGWATAFRTEERDGGAAVLRCDATLDIDPGTRVLAPSVSVTGEAWTIRFLRLVHEHKNPRASLTPRPHQ